MMKFMKRSLSLLISAMLLLGCFALAEEAPLLPIAIVSYDLTDEATTAARLRLLEAVAQVVRNGLDLLGVCAPDAM